MEQFRRYFESISVLYVLEDNLPSKLCGLMSNICPKFTEISLLEFLSKKEQMRSQFVILELSQASKESLLTIFGKFLSLETLVVCDNTTDHDVIDTAISYKVCGVIGRSPTSRELGEKLKLVIMSISARQKERTKNDNYIKLSENGGLLSCIKRAGKITFANAAMLAYCKAENVAELNTMEAPKGSILEAVRESGDGENSFYIRTESLDPYLINIKNLKNEQIISCVKTIFGMDKQSDSLGHTEFIELLKNMLTQRDVSSEPTFAVAVKLENAQKIINDFGSEFFYNYFAKFSAFCGLFFDKDPFVFWCFDYIVILSEEYNLESVKGRAEQLFMQSGQFKCEKDVTPFINLSVLSFAHLSINASISLIEKIYSKTQTQAQNAKVCLTLSSTSVSVADGQMAMYHIQNIADKDYKIKLLNIYKGISLASASKIIKVVNGDIYVQTEKLQKYLMHTEKSVIIQSEYVPKEIFAEVKYIDPVEPYAILANPLFLEFSANNRKSVRVQCDARIPITLTSSKYTFTGEIFDISMHAIAVRYNNRINGDIVGTSVKLNFLLPNKESENGMAKVSIPGEIVVVKTIDGQMRVIVDIKINLQSEEIMLEYIYSRQKELITEIKKLGGMIFK